MTEPLVFLPGMMCDARLFGPQIAALSADHAVMTVPISNSDRISEIASYVLEQAPEKFALAGLSMGGVVAMEVMRRAPDRVRRIALMDTNPLAETPQSAATYEPMIVGVRTGKMAKVMRDFMRPEYLAPGPHRSEILELTMDMALNNGPDVFERQARALQRRRDQQSTLRKCKVPALVLCGEHDGLTPVKRHTFMAELIPYAKLEVIGDAGHLPTLEQPDATTAALRQWMKQPFVLR